MAKKEKKPKKGKEPEAEAEKPEAAPVAEGAEGEAPAKKKLSGKTLILFIVLPALLVLGGGGAVTMMLLGGGKTAEAGEAAHGGEADAKKKEAEKKKKEEEKKKKEGEHGGGHGAEGGKGGEASADVGHLTVGEDGEPSYYALPKILVNLASKAEGDRPQLLELSLVLEASDASTFDDVPSLMPRLQDTFQSFLRELRVEDLDGSAGSYRLRIELLKRFNVVMAPAKVDAVLIEGMLVQ